MKVSDITLTVSNRRGFINLYDNSIFPQAPVIIRCERKHTLGMAVSSSLLVVSSFIFTGITVCEEQDK